MTARSFLTSADYLQATATVTAAPFTIAGWGLTTDLTATQCLMSLHNPGASSGQHQFLLVVAGTTAGDPLIFSANNNATSAQATTSSGVSSGVWFHFAAIARAANDREVFLNGGSSGTNSTTKTPASANRLNVGLRRQSTDTLSLTGRVAYPALWSEALAADEVTALAAGVHPLLIRPQSLASCWSMVNGYDLFGNATFSITGTTLDDGPPILMPDEGEDWLSASPTGGASLFRRSLYRRAGSRGVL